MAADPIRSEESFYQSTSSNQSSKTNFSSGSASSGSAGADMNLEQIWARAKAVVSDPINTWETIKNENTSIEQLYRNYIVVLAAIPAICHWISGTLFGHLPLISGTIFTIVQFVVNLAVLFGFSLIIEALSPKFDGTATRVDGLKLLAYSATPGWLGGIFGLIGALAPISLLCALYGLYIYFKGIPILRASSEEKSLSFLFTSIGAFLLVGIGIVTLGFLTGFGFFAAHS